MSAFTALFLTFFVCSLLLLAVMVVVLFPAMFHALMQVIRTFRARRNREFRINGGREATEAELRQVEAIYHFEADSVRE